MLMIVLVGNTLGGVAGIGAGRMVKLAIARAVTGRMIADVVCISQPRVYLPWMRYMLSHNATISFHCLPGVEVVTVSSSANESSVMGMFL